MLNDEINKLMTLDHKLFPFPGCKVFFNFYYKRRLFIFYKLNKIP